jgi:hypothetical protein
MPPKVRLWHVYLVEHCAHTKPPKSKYVVIVHYAEGYPMGFLINSQLPRWLQKKPYLLPCEASIIATEHPSFLKYDSYVDCSRLFPFNGWDFKCDKGNVSLQAKADILEAVRNCRVLEQKYKQAILEREGIALGGF